MLVDPADENLQLALPPEVHSQNAATGITVLKQYASGELADTVWDTFRPFAQHLTAIPAV